MALGILEVKNGGKFFGELSTFNNDDESAFNFDKTDMVSVSGVRGTVTEALVNVRVNSVQECPWDAVDLTVTP